MSNIKIETIEEESDDGNITDPKLSVSSIYGDATSEILNPDLPKERPSQTKYIMTATFDEDIKYSSVSQPNILFTESGETSGSQSGPNVSHITNRPSDDRLFYHLTKTREANTNESYKTERLMLNDTYNENKSKMDIHVILESTSNEHASETLQFEDEDKKEDKKIDEDVKKKVDLKTYAFKTQIMKKASECEVCKYCRVIGNEILHNHAQEPWPKDVRLFQPYEVEQILLPDNANCLAVQTFLKMCNLEYTVDPRPNAEAMSPTGKVPFIKCGAFIVAELEGIVQFVGSKGISLTQDMSQDTKSDMRAYMTLVNNVLGNAELYICWCDEETYRDVTKPRYGSIYPWPLNHIQAWTKRNEELKRLKLLSWQNKPLEEVYSEVETCCQALTDRLDGHDYFFGSNYTELDALVYAHLFLILTVSLPAHLGTIVNKFPHLVHFCEKIDQDVMHRKNDLNPKLFKKPGRHVVFKDRSIRSPTKEEVEKVIFSESNIHVHV